MNNYTVRGVEIGNSKPETFGNFETLEAARGFVIPRIAGHYNNGDGADTTWAEIIDLDTNQVVEMHGDK